MNKFTKIFKVLLCVICLSLITISLWTGFLAITGVILMNFFTLEVAANIAIYIATILILIIFVMILKP
jgi:hypothetical protein